MSLLTPRPGILEITPYKGGGFVPTGSNIWGLASNENLLGPSKKALKAFENASPRINRYPEQSGLRVKMVLSELHEMPTEKIVIGNGSDEILSLLFRAYLKDEDEVILSENGFSLFPILAKAQNAKICLAKEKNFTTHIDSILEQVSEKTKIICIANPNNPTGTYIPESELNRLCTNVSKQVLIIIDSAYAEYVTHNDYSNGKEFVEKFDNVVMTRTLSKIYGLAGLRVGWAYASEEIVEIVDRIRLAFHVNSIAQDVAIAALEDQEFVKKSREQNTYWKSFLENELKKLQIPYIQTVTNFAFLPLSSERDNPLCNLQNYLKEQLILTRPISLPNAPNCLRITIGPQGAIEALVDSLQRFFKTNNKRQMGIAL